MADRETVLVALDRQEACDLLNSSPLRDLAASSPRLDIKISRIVPDNAAVSSDGFIQRLRVHEDELFRWFAKAPENGKAFLADPRAAFMAATSASSDWIDKLTTMGKGAPDSPEHEVDAEMPATAPAEAWKAPLELREFMRDRRGRIISTTCVLGAGDVIYAGSWHSIYKLRAADGQLLLWTDLAFQMRVPRFGGRAMQMALSDDGQNLFIGCDGFVICVRASDFVLRWQCRIGKRSVNLLADGGELYAGSRGRVVKLRQETGSVLLENDLKRRGKREVRLALSEDKACLFVGTAGHVLSLSARDLTTQWQTRLKRTGKKAFSILTRKQELYAAGYGRLFRLGYFDGNVQRRSRLKGTGRHDVSMQFSGDGTALLTGIYGQVLSVCPKCFEIGWQTDLGVEAADVTLAAKGNAVFAASARHLFRLLVPDGRTTFRKSVSCCRKPLVPPGMVLSKDGTHVVVACGTFISQVPEHGDLSAGWQAIIATRRHCVNETFASLFAAGVLPKYIETTIIVGGSQCRVRVSVANAPEIVGGETRQLTLKVALPGTIDGVIPQRITGYVELTVDLEKIQVHIERENANDLLLSFGFADGVFNAIDTSHLQIDPPLRGLGKGVLAITLIKDAIHAIHQQLQFHIHTPWPLSLDGLVVRVAYTKVPEDPARDFLSLLFGLASDPGSLDLTPAIMGAKAKTAFVLSNYWTMEGIRAGISRDDGADFGFELSNAYPASISNTRTVKVNDVLNVLDLKISKRHVQIFIHKGVFHVNVSVSYKVLFWNPAELKARIGFSAEGGNIRAHVEAELTVPWDVFLLPLTPLWAAGAHYLKRRLAKLIDEHGDSVAFVPWFDVTGISTPGYVQILGDVNRGIPAGA